MILVVVSVPLPLWAVQVEAAGKLAEPVGLAVVSFVALSEAVAD